MTAYSLHPGVVQTDLWRHLSGTEQFLMKFAKPFSKNSVQGAQTTIYCAVEPSLEKESGGYYRLALVSLLLARIGHVLSSFRPRTIYSVRIVLVIFKHVVMVRLNLTFSSLLSACSATALLPAARPPVKTTSWLKSCGS